MVVYEELALTRTKVTTEMKNVIVADIDGCCIHSEERLPFLLSGDLDGYHKNHPLDEPIPQGVVVYKKFLSDPDYRFYFVTGRSEAGREYTLKQLREWISPTITSAQLLMRPDNLTPAHMHDTILKPYLLELENISLPQIFLVFEDRNSMVSMWRSLGLVCYQPAFGDY